MVAVRAVVLGLAATLYAIVPLPLPLTALVIDSHGALLVAFQLHPAIVEIENVPVAAFDVTEMPAGDSA
jgi:hypothetical protein